MKKSSKNDFFGLSAGFLKGKMDFENFAENWKNLPKIFFWLSVGFLKRKNRLWWQLKRWPKNHVSDFLQDFWNEKVDFKQCSGKWIISLKDRWVAIFLKDGK